MCLYEVSPRSVTLLAFEMWQRDHLNYSVDVHTIGFVYDPKEGWCVRESFEPPNIGQLTPVRVGECADNGLEDPDLPPTAWLPGNIGLWNPYQQAAGAFGVVVARFKDQSQGAPQRPIPGGLAPSDQESADNE